MKPSLVILGAGASSRLGNPKLLARIGYREQQPVTVLDHILATAEHLCEGRPLVVTGKDHTLIASKTGKRPEVHNHREWATGRTGSIMAAVRRRPGKPLLLWPADSPCITNEDMVAMVQAFSESPPMGWLAPRCPDGRFGHPLLLGADLAQEILTLAPDESLRSIRSQARPLLGVDLPHYGARINLDTPAALEEARKWYGKLRSD